MAGPDNRPAHRPHVTAPDGYRQSRAGHQKGREPADPAIVALAEQLAGDGDLDDRCRRILAVFAPWWGLEPKD